MVTLDYTVFDAQNNLLDSGSTPLIYLHRNYGDVFEKIEKSLDGKSIGHNIQLHLTPEEAFGEYQHELVLIEERTIFEEELEVGQSVDMHFTDEEGEMLLSYNVVEINEQNVVLDANHPLAGVPIFFDCTVIGIREASLDEIEEKLNSFSAL